MLKPLLALLPRTIPASLLAVLLTLGYGLAAQPAAAQVGRSIEGQFDGELQPDGDSPPIPVSVQLKSMQGILLGQVRTSPPLAGDGPITAGDFDGTNCNIRAQISAGVTVRLSGTCQQQAFEGKYTLSAPIAMPASGTFRLLRNGDGTSKKAERREPATLNPFTACLNANTRCLVACPQGEYNAEMLCARRCRQRFQACKGSKAAPAGETSGTTPGNP